MTAWLVRMTMAVCTVLLPAVAAADFVVAQIAPLSGPLAPTGEHMRAGAQLYFDRVNAAGGVHGQKIRMVVRDDGYRIEDTVKLAREAIAKDDPIVLYGIVGTGNIAALVKEGVLDKAGIAAVGLRTGAASLLNPPHPYLFTARASYATEVERMIEQMTTMGMNRIGVFFQDDAFGRDGLVAAEAALRGKGLEIAAQGAYERNTTKVEAAAAAIAAVNPQGVVMVSNTAASTAFVTEYRKRGGDGMLLVLSTTDGPQVVERLGREAAHGLAIAQIVPHPQSRTMPLVREFQETYARGVPAGIEMNHTLLQGYVGGKIIVEALRRAGPNATRATLRDALEGIRNYDLGGIRADFSPTRHTGVDFVDITIIGRDGRLLQ
ncbi:ABC transporter substrate-binding protein [Pseudothauera rhizosphaerae]|nr:ABC transporter substrate-binding protein [Pseudothauera rhizosphaerae]